jgi:hypothetical protein
MYDFAFTDDNGTITYICAKSRSEAIKIYCREKGCPEEYVKKHCVIRHTKLPRSEKMVKGE